MKNNLLMKIIFFILFFCVLVNGQSSRVHAANAFSDPKQFIKNNPDGKKYEFVRDYIESLKFLKQNQNRAHSMLQKDYLKKDSGQKIEILKQNLVLDNFNLRVAKGLLRKYYTPENGLMLKATDTFNKMVDELADINNRESAQIEILLSNKTKITPDLIAFENKSFAKTQNKWALKRRETYRKLIQTALLIPDILVSSKPNEYGEFVTLGISKNERTKLLKQLDAFDGDKYRGDLRSGQTFLQASVSVIRKILEDDSWDTIN